MPLTVLKNTKTHAVAVVNASGVSTDTITLASLALAGEQTATNPRVNIKALHFTIPTGQTATVTRNATLLWTLSQSCSIPFNGFSDTRQNGADIVVALSGGGNVVVELAKVSGYGDTEHINPA